MTMPQAAGKNRRNNTPGVTIRQGRVAIYLGIIPYLTTFVTGPLVHPCVNRIQNCKVL